MYRYIAALRGDLLQRFFHRQCPGGAPGGDGAELVHAVLLTETAVALLLPGGYCENYLRDLCGALECKRAPYHNGNSVKERKLLVYAVHPGGAAPGQYQSGKHTPSVSLSPGSFRAGGNIRIPRRSCSAGGEPRAGRCSPGIQGRTSPRSRPGGTPAGAACWLSW